jgi:hypothetical protein
VNLGGGGSCFGGINLNGLGTLKWIESIDSNPALGLNMGPEMGCINDYKGSTQLEIISCAGGYLRFDIQTLKTPQIASNCMVR